MNLSPVGYFSRTHGTKGQLVMKVQSDFDYLSTKAIFIEQNGSMAPYFIQEFKENQNDLIVTLEEIDSIEKAKLLLNKTVSVHDQLIYEEEENNWTEYELIEKKYGTLGKVAMVSDNGNQVLWHFNFNGKEIILPLVESFIENIDELEKKIFYNAPEGLIEVYLDTD